MHVLHILLRKTTYGQKAGPDEGSIDLPPGAEYVKRREVKNLARLLNSSNRQATRSLIVIGVPTTKHKIYNNLDSIVSSSSFKFWPFLYTTFVELTCRVSGVALRSTACENETLAVSCDGPNVIHIINAHYGRLEMETCESNIDTPNTECLFAGTRDIVFNRSVNYKTGYKKQKQTLV